MFLKSLAMKGFKSFADSTVLEFEPGVTVVVGPNGSGKSNVVDAVTWVLGAQGPRSLRSAKMEDVIFAGTSSRSALGRAEVSLTIDNTSAKLPVETAEVTITRTLFRSGDSEYAINGTPCRLLDIQELLSDSGVGRSQHMIIGQGQLDTVLNARPEDRRAIIEEAAGVLKHRRRRERADRRLTQTQENLERLGDLVREVRRQMRPLERQAVAARSHATLAEELRATRLYLAGTELKALGARRSEVEAGFSETAARESRLRARLDELDQQATSTAAELSSRREEDLATAVGTLQGLVERARGTASVLRERRRAITQALDASADENVVSNLEAEAARIDGALVALELDTDDLDHARLELEAAEATLAADEAAYLASDDADTDADAEHSLEAGRARFEAQGRVVAQREALERSLTTRAAALSSRRQELHAAATALSTTEAAAAATATSLRSELDLSARATSAAEEALTRAVDEASATNEQRHRTAARAEALGRALADLEGAAGQQVARDVDGVVGALFDLIEIDEGFEKAVEAAAGGALGAVVVSGKTSARAVLTAIQAHGSAGLVLAPRAGLTTVDPAGLPHGAAPLRPHLRPRAGVAPSVGDVLDALVGQAVVVADIEAAIELSLDRAELVVVTSDGDRFSTSGWRIQSSAGVVTRAAVEAAETTALAAAALADAASAALEQARVALEETRRTHAGLVRDVDRLDAEAASAVRDRERLSAELARVDTDLAVVNDELSDAVRQLGIDRGELDALAQVLPDLERAAQGAASIRVARAERARELEAQRRSVDQQRRGLAVVIAERSERERVLRERRTEIERRLEGHAEERAAAAARRSRLEADGGALDRLRTVVDAELERLQGTLEAWRSQYQRQMEAVRAGGAELERLRRDRAGVEQELQTTSDRLRSLEVETTEISMKLGALNETIEHQLGADHETVLSANCPELPEGVTPEAHASSLAARLGALGPINPLALEELAGLEERQRDLDTQVSDVRAARRELQDVLRTLDEEIMSTFAAAAADVNEHFSTLVAMLFPGGTGRLVLTDPEDLLNTGVEVEVKPLGRNVRRVSLLSGGERSMAALAFLFAVFRSRPSPFYLMDEVEAALDDVNLHRFLGLIAEFRSEAQLIVVSHQKRTMETADALYGVTMAPGGSSKVVSQKVARRDAPREDVSA